MPIGVGGRVRLQGSGMVVALASITQRVQRVFGFIWASPSIAGGFARYQG